MGNYFVNFGFYFFAGICILGFVAGTDTTEYKDECIVDKSKEPTEDGNYKDCTTEQHVADGSTDCCTVDGVVDCCNKSASWWTLIWICIGIVTTTIVLALLCFWIYWCDEQSCPWIRPYKRKWDEKTGNCKRKVCCCCVDDDDNNEDYMKKTPPKSNGLPDYEVRPESSVSNQGSFYHSERIDSPRSMDSPVVDVQPGPESNEMPPEYQTEVKDDFFNF